MKTGKYLAIFDGGYWPRTAFGNTLAQAMKNTNCHKDNLCKPGYNKFEWKLFGIRQGKIIRINRNGTPL